MRRRALTLAVICWGAVGTGARADAPAAAGAPPEAVVTVAAAEEVAPAAAAGPRVAVVLVATRGTSADTVDSLSEVLIGAIARRGGVNIVGKEEFQAQLAQGDEGTLTCMSSAPCLGRVGVQLGVVEVIAGTVAERPSAWVFNLNRIDIETGLTVGRVFREVPGDEGDVADALVAALAGLYAVVREPATLEIESTVDGAEVSIDGIVVGRAQGDVVRQTDLPPGRHEVRVRARGYREWRRTVDVRAGITLSLEADLIEPAGSAVGVLPFWIGVGVAAAGVGVATVFSVRAVEEPSATVTRAEAAIFYDARRDDALIANLGWAAVGVGAAAALVGLILMQVDAEETTDARAEVVAIEEGPRVLTELGPDGALVGVRGSF